MKGFLNQSQIAYVFYHLGHHIFLNDAIKESFAFVRQGQDISAYSKRIIFPLSEKQFDPAGVIFCSGIPMLFPVLSGPEQFASINGNIIFNDDLLKSAFYLLTGYQEINPVNTDHFGRFEYESSVQARLDIMARPVVNYYFNIIAKGISEFCRIHSIEFSRKNLFSSYAFLLTHDVDRVIYYNLNSLLNTIKQLAGFLKTGRKKSFLFKEIFRIGAHIINNPEGKDPYWNFSFLSELEKSLGIRSTWFFLPEDQKHIDSYYKLTDKKIQELIGFLMNEGHEIGLHGTVRSHQSAEALMKIKNELASVTGKESQGIRQHRLMWKHPGTALIHEKTGFAYDATLGFAGHEGFRNSYCHPFRLYDFENERMLNHWEIPLIVMESTLFDYRKLDFISAQDTVDHLVNEIRTFNGVFTLLWHNNYFDEAERPGITAFYKNLLERIMSDRPEILTGKDIIKKLI